MDKRLLVIFVVLAGLGFLYLSTAKPEGELSQGGAASGVEDVARGAGSGAPVADPAKTLKFEERFVLSSVSEDAGFEGSVSNMFATFASVRMHKAQYYQADNTERPSGLPDELRGEIPERYYAEGKLELVSTWDPFAYPFQAGFDSFDHDQRVSRELRPPRGAGRFGGEDRLRFEVAEADADFHSAYPRVRKGDLLEILPAGADAGGQRWAIADVLGDGALLLDEAPGPELARAGLRYRVVATGRFDELMGRDPRFTKVAEAEGSLTFVWPDPARDDSRVFLERKLSLAGPHLVDVEIALHNLSTSDLRAQPVLRTVSYQPPVEGGGMFSGPPPDQRGALCHVAGELHRATLGELLESPENEDWRPVGDVSWMGSESRYFLLSAIPATSGNTYCRMRGARVKGLPPLGVMVVDLGRTKTTVVPGAKHVACRPTWLEGADWQAVPTCESMAALLEVSADASPKAVEEAYNRKKDSLDEEGRKQARLAWEALRGRQVAQSRYQLYMGPKDLAYLEALEAPLEDAMDFWIVGVIAKPMVSALKLFHEWIPSWGVAILILTLLVKLLLAPLTHWSFKSMQGMQRLKPEMDELKAKYGNDRQKLNEEMMALYKRHKINPMGGCFPMLLQMPIWIALYRAIYSSVELYQAPLGGWIQDLSAPDPFYVLPLVMGLSMFLQQRMTPTTLDSQQARIMLWVMPIMFTVFMLFLPAGLVLYIFVNTLLSMAQQYYIKRQDRPPVKPAPTKA